MGDASVWNSFNVAGLHSLWLNQGLYSPEVDFETDHLYVDLPGILHVMFGVALLDLHLIINNLRGVFHATG
jgi:hypothetical protein